MARIIVPIDEPATPVVAANFGRAAAFWVQDDDRPGEVVANTAAGEPGGAGIKAAQQVLDLNPDALLAPRLGDNAARVLHAAGIELRRSRPGPVADTLTAHARGELDELTDFHPGHHGATA